MIVVALRAIVEFLAILVHVTDEKSEMIVRVEDVNKGPTLFSIPSSRSIWAKRSIISSLLIPLPPTLHKQARQTKIKTIFPPK